MEQKVIKRKADDVLQVVYGLLEVLKEFEIKPDNFCITGSYALTYLGLNLDRPLNDVDLYLKIDPNNNDQNYQGALKRLVAMQYVSGYVNPYKNKEEVIVIDFQGMKVNIFIVIDQNFGFRTIMTSRGYHIDTVEHLLSKKMALKRPKDYQDLNTIIKNLLNYDSK